MQKMQNKCFGLDAIIAVGYRVNSKKATRFRKWATKTLLHFAVTGKSVMGLITWKDSPDGKVLKREISIAKKYLNEKELSRLNSW